MTNRSTPQEDFWSAHPCGANGPYAERVKFRYTREPWIPPLLTRIGARHKSVLEVGCGQGIDGLAICKAMTEGTYVGIDYSPESVAVAQAAAVDAAPALEVKPSFATGSALDLAFPDQRFDCVYSLGVMHHTPSTQRCVDEAYRVLRPGGIAYIALYRRPSLKVGAARFLRFLQRQIDRLTGRDRTLYHLAARYGIGRSSGTMVLEGFGVPYLEWYSRSEMLTLFEKFSVVELVPVGANLFHRAHAGNSRNPWGYMWLMIARKPQAA